MFFLVVAVVEDAVVEGVLVIDGEDFVAELLFGEGDADAGVAVAFALEDGGARVDGGIAGADVGIGEDGLVEKILELFAAGIEGVENVVDAGFG